MILFFLKSKLRELESEQVSTMLESDFRVKQLLQMIFDRYENIDFEYQLGTIMALGMF
eukprot:CAMPEP_0116885374 /NCGR_PEP_ID=MMETSP0463-20121206/18682_1 /TAXON_ID=181622 /ORGANISM="Strombidinopsis sp, Strain SopsisLIS2011" /LENGTH=57 /DNA_ID=CAMNT_0004543647 /DNA_START=345 /DNA_END=518 /DNA_ORIENTATION=+